MNRRIRIIGIFIVEDFKTTMKKFLYTLTFLFFSLQFSAQEQSIDELIDRSTQKIDSKSYKEAIPLLTKVLDKEYNNHLALNKLGICYFELGDYSKAKENFRQAVLYSGKNANYLSNLSAAFSRLNDDEKAYEYARRALAIEETQLSLFNAVSLANNVNRVDECITLLNKSKLEKHNDFNSLYGRCYYKQKDFKNSIDKYERYFENDGKTEKFVEEINDEQERQSLQMAYLFEIVSPKTNESLKNDYLQKLRKSLKTHPYEGIKKSFLMDENICTQYKIPAEKCAKLYQSIFDSAQSSIEELRDQYYIKKDYQKAFDLASQLPDKKYSGDDLFTLKLIRYLSSVQLFSEDYLKNKRKPNMDLLAQAEERYKKLYENGKMYSDGEMSKSEKLQIPFTATLEIFKNGPYKSAEVQNKVGNYVYRILMQTPNENFRLKLKELFDR